MKRAWRRYHSRLASRINNADARPIDRLVLFVLRWKKTRAYKIFKPARPGFVRVAAYVRTHGDQRRFRFDDADIKIDVEDQVRNLLHSSSYRKIGAELFCKIGVTAATGLEVRLACLRPDRGKSITSSLPELATSARS